MEQPENQLHIIDSEPKVKQYKTYERECEHCNNKFEAKLSNARFCSNACRAANYRTKQEGQKEEQKPGNLPMPQPTALFTSSNVNSLPPHAVYIIDAQKREIDRWEKAFNEEKTARKDAEKKNLDLRDELARIKVDHQIESIQNQKPSGLNGFVESPFVTKLLDHVGPAIGAFLMRAQEQTQPQQLVSGTDGQLDDETQIQLSNINTWFAQQTPEIRQQVYSILDNFARMTTPEMMQITITKITNLLKNGTTIKPPAVPGTGTFN